MSRFNLKGRPARIGAAAIATAAAATLGLAVAPAQASTARQIVDVTGAVFACAGGVTYTVTSGDALFTFHESTDRNGGTHVTGTIAPSNVLLVSSANGATYRLAGASWFGGNVSADGSPLILTDTEHFQIVGPGGVVGNVQTTSHITVNANGTTTVSFEKASGICTPPED